MCLSIRIALTPPYAQVMKRQTCQTQTLVPEKACGFNSRPAH